MSGNVAARLLAIAIGCVVSPLASGCGSNGSSGSDAGQQGDARAADSSARDGAAVAHDGAPNATDATGVDDAASRGDAGARIDSSVSDAGAGSDSSASEAGAGTDSSASDSSGGDAAPADGSIEDAADASRADTGGSAQDAGSPEASLPDGSADAGDGSIETASCGAMAAGTDPFSPGYTADPQVTSRAQSAVSSLSLGQQATLMRGEPSQCPNYPDFVDIWSTPGVPGTAQGFRFRNGTRGVSLSDGSTVAIGMGNYSTTFPCAAARAASFDLTLEQRIGVAMGDEMVASGHDVLLAPSVDVLRHPAWGRSQESYGEDPYLVGRMGSALVSGVQTFVPACAAHLGGYNVETKRETLTAVADEQTAYEIYGRPFEMVVRDGGVACVMAAYNAFQIGSAAPAACTESTDLLTTMLRGTFGFQGWTLSDWWALPGGDACVTVAAGKTTAAAAVGAGLDMELPWSLNYAEIEADVDAGALTATQVASSATRIVEQAMRFDVFAPGQAGLQPATSSYDAARNSIANASAHGQLAYQAALESMVLLKNANATLPIPASVKNVAVVGAQVPFVVQETDVSSGVVHFATDVRTGDLGSSHTYSDPAVSFGPYDGVRAAAPSGVTVINATTAAGAASADFIIVVAGLTPEDEGEEFTGAGDRTSFDLDDKNVHVHGQSPVQVPLIQAVAALGKPMAVVLEAGSVIDMSPWIASVPAVVMAWYPGQAGGKALGDLLFANTGSNGKKANFSGKLPVTWAAWKDEPALLPAPPSSPLTLDYYEGYRFFDEHAVAPVFPFGAGLSYTTFAYANLQLPCATASPGAVVDIEADVTNTGAVDGDEVTLLFVSYPDTAVRRSMKELKGFARTSIAAGETQRVRIPLRVDDLKYWDATNHRWSWEAGANGTVRVEVGGSSASLPLTGSFRVTP